MAKRFVRTKDRNREIRQEKFILDVTEQVFASMAQKSISKVVLASRLDKSKAYISQLLSGSRNMTLRTLADICWALDVAPKLKLEQGGFRVPQTENFVAYSCRPESRADLPMTIEKVPATYLVAHDVKPADSLSGDWETSGRIVRAQKKAA